jgi:hypothetical protein
MERFDWWILVTALFFVFVRKGCYPTPFRFIVPIQGLHLFLINMRKVAVCLALYANGVSAKSPLSSMLSDRIKHIIVLMEVKIGVDV